MELGGPTSLSGSFCQSLQCVADVMAGERLAPWRKTGRRADPRHFEGLETGAFLEFSGYNDRHRQQGRMMRQSGFVGA